MRNGKHVAKSTGSKMLVTVIALALVCCMAVGGTMAWLMDSTDEVVNTFTSSDVSITLEENKAEEKEDAEGNKYLANSYKMIPGYTITKDPKVTVKEGSENCFLFVKLEKSANFDSFFEAYETDGWTKLADDMDGNTLTDVYYRQVITSDGKPLPAEQSFNVLKDNQLKVLSSVSKEAMNALTEDTYPQLTVTAYAIQLNESNDTAFTPAAAWAAISTTP